MTLIQTIYSNHIPLNVGKQGVHSTKVGALTPVYKKSATEPKSNFLRCQSIVNIATFNIRSLNPINQLPEMTVSAAQHNIDILP